MESDINTIFSSLEKNTKDLKSYKDKRIHDLSIADQKITDINHYIEFNKLNACQGYKMSKLLQDTLKECREIKNELEILGQVNGFSMKSISNGKIKTACNIKQKKYKPRVLKELFN